MKHYFSIFLLVIATKVFGQELESLTLIQSQELAQKNYPLIKQRQLIKKTEAISLENLQKGFLPQLNISAQATYQSDVTKIPVSVPGFSFDPPSKDQYKLVADVSQLIYDGGITKEQKALQQINTLVEDQKIEVELYKLKERITQLYLSVLFLDEQLKQVDLVHKDIQIGIKRVDAQIANGVAFRSNSNMLKAENLTVEQRGIELRSSKKGLIDVLSLFLGQTLSDNIQLEEPFSENADENPVINRPEIKLFTVQEEFINQQDKLVTAKNLPKASLFAQGGYGRPALNLLKNEFDFYYVGGVRFNWSLSGLYTKKKEKEQLAINKNSITIQKETFLLNTNLQLKQQHAEVEKLKLLVESDNEIIALRKSVTEAAKAQLENGVITTNDFLKEVNAEDQARQSLITHKVQLIQAKINYQIILGN